MIWIGVTTAEFTLLCTIDFFKLPFGSTSLCFVFSGIIIPSRMNTNFILPLKCYVRLLNNNYTRLYRLSLKRTFIYIQKISSYTYCFYYKLYSTVDPCKFSLQFLVLAL